MTGSESAVDLRHGSLSSGVWLGHKHLLRQCPMHVIRGFDKDCIGLELLALLRWRSVNCGWLRAAGAKDSVRLRCLIGDRRFWTAPQLHR